MFTAKDLKEILNKVDDDTPVVFVSGTNDNVSNDFYETGEVRITRAFQDGGEHCQVCLIPV